MNRSIAAAQQALKTALYHLDAAQGAHHTVVADHEREVARCKRKLNKEIKAAKAL